MNKRNPRSLASYSYERRVFDLAVAKNGLRMKCDSNKAAAGVRARFNRFRARHREHFGSSISGTAYDALQLTIEDDVLVFSRKDEDFPLFDAAGNPLDLPETDNIEGGGNMQLPELGEDLALPDLPDELKAMMEN